MEWLYVNGCSFSCAGGLDIPEVKDLYLEKNITIDNHLDFAWPTILSKKLNINLVNDSVQGGSLNRLIRTTYEHLIKTNFSNNTFYLLELPPVWRDELYSTFLKRFVNITHGNLKNPEFDGTEEANGHPKKEFLRIHKNALEWFESFVNYDIENEKTFNNLLGLISLFNLKNIKFYFLENDAWFRLKLEKLEIEFPYIDFVQGFNNSFIHNNLTIKDEIGYYDGHAGIQGNKFAADKIYKFLIQNNIFIIN